MKIDCFPQANLIRPSRLSPLTLRTLIGISSSIQSSSKSDLWKDPFLGIALILFVYLSYPILKTSSTTWLSIIGVSSSAKEFQQWRLKLVVFGSEFEERIQGTFIFMRQTFLFLFLSLHHYNVDQTCVIELPYKKKSLMEQTYMIKPQYKKKIKV